jgi:hypothetical protein
VTDQNVGVGTKLEEGFLGLLRIVILLVLTVSLFATCYFLFSGLADMKAEPKEYKYEQFNGEGFVNEIKDQFDEKKSPPTEQAPAKQKKSEKKVNKALEDELDKQVSIVAEFLKRAEKSLSDQTTFKNRLRNNATSLAFDKSDEGVLTYASGQTAFFSLVFKNPEILALEEKYRASENVDFIGSFFSEALSFYPNFHSQQAEKKNAFEAEQAAGVLEAKAASMVKLYTAGGFFAAFLLISLILVLVKIERDLRFR